MRDALLTELGALSKVDLRLPRAPRVNCAHAFPKLPCTIRLHPQHNLPFVDVNF
jgi:hypothetical protein